MTRDDIIKLAREAGLSRVQADLLELGKDVSFDIEMLDAFAALVAAAEREACIRDCDGVDLVGADECIAAIRARGQA
jgi:hypothetical protein|uniref:Uncharacterized protein n=1 Tax=Podoviridae sp. ctwJH20 TaxID=2827753 RepID=A0A8S5TBK3_9CAUD|nr:MAG TPA: hypothetical protein [Podoviridae sp. ctwJH20]